jgi:hypothetical protein
VLGAPFVVAEKIDGAKETLLEFKDPAPKDKD